MADGKPLHLVSRTALNKTPSNKFLRGAQVEHASTFFVAQVADVERIIPPKPSDSSEARTRSMTVPRGANGSRRETDHQEVGGKPCSAYRSLRVTRPCIPSLNPSLEKSGGFSELPRLSLQSTMERDPALHPLRLSTFPLCAGAKFTNHHLPWKGTTMLRLKNRKDNVSISTRLFLTVILR